MTTAIVRYVLVGLFWATAAAAANQEPPFAKTCTWPTAPRHAHTHTIGGAAGFIQGLGFTYRYWSEINGLQLTLLPTGSIREDSRSLLLSVAPTWLHALWESPLYDFFHQPSRNLVYSYVGLHYFIDYQKDDEEDASWSRNGLDQHWFLGGGLGLQTNLSAIQFSLGVGFATSLHDSRNWEKDITPAHSTEWVVQPTIDATLGYTFGW